MSIELELRSRRNTLKLLRKDIHQIFSVGKSIIEGSEPTLVPNTFFSMYPSASESKLQYMSEFKEASNLAVMKGQDTLFPNDDDLKLRSEVNTIFYKIVEFYQILSQNSSNNKPNNTCSESNEANISSLNHTLARSRLPKIELPKFSGVIGDWPKFKQLFESIIHNNTDIPTIEKYHYLSTSISGEAQSLITSFTITDENYPKAWDALCQRYDNKRLLATSYIDKVLDFNPPKCSPSLSSLQNFIATVGESIASLKSVNIRDEADFIWLTLALRKLDSDTRKQFEIHSVKKEWPTFAELIEFVYGRCKVLQLSECPENSKICRPLRSPIKPHILTTTNLPSSSSSSKFPCHCRPSHPLYQCPIFQGKSPNARKTFLKGKLICFNCLRPGHIVNDCSSSSRCQTCSGKHHTLLHFTMRSKEPCSAGSPSNARDQPPSKEHGSTACRNTPGPSFIASVTGPTQVLLGTAEVLILNSQNVFVPVRLLVDCGSQFSLITSQCAKRLGLSWKPSNHRPLGAGETPLPKVRGKLQCKLKSRLPAQNTFEVYPLVVNTITGTLPSSPLTPILSKNLNSKILADPKFWEPRSIEFLLGGDLFMKIVTGAPTSIDENYEALPTIFGHVVMGTAAKAPSPISNFLCHCLTEPEITDKVIMKFWETEDLFSEVKDNSLDVCEEHFQNTHYRDPTGRYVVALPFKESSSNLEGSFSIAALQYKSLENKFQKSPLYKAKYQDFLQEYLDLGHMSLATTPSAFVIPHHGVFKARDPESKIRVVFNASSRTKNGSLNDKLHVGPKLQTDLTDIILNFRRHPIAVTADLVKMYRQILVRPEDRKFQHILWRPNAAQQVQVYELNTVTYGVVSAAYLALRVIIQLVKDEGNSYPMAAKTLSEDIYVDDIVSGADNVESALELKRQLTDLLEKGGFTVHKWASNSLEFSQASDTPETGSPLALSPKDSTPTKILGMSWNPFQDTFFYEVSPISKCVSKRSILSVIARLFDPMGYLAPVIFRAKTILQSMWRAHIDWDEKPDQELIQAWMEFANQLPQLNEVRIPRYVLTTHINSLEIIGFCDASQKGYAAALYLRVTSTERNVRVSLLKAKTKLAPLKTISVPRLELCAAHLLSRLFLSVQRFITSIQASDFKFFTDSTIVLAWLRISPHLLQSFIANRVSFIVSHTEASQWHHVSSADNPADIATRGIEPALLQHHSLWWAGPAWLHNPQWTPSSPPSFVGEIPELRSGVSLMIASEPDLVQWMAKYSSYQRMLNTLSYVKRFISNTRPGKPHFTGPLTAMELDSALMSCIKTIQTHEFQQEFAWRENQPLSKRLQVLAAYQDEQGVLRVGGRLQNADLSEETKFPIILPGQCHLVSLMVHHLHYKHFHLGFQAMQGLIRRKYWIFRLRQVIKKQLRKCLTCFKMTARPQTPFMGNLPSCRVRPSRPFSECGVDFAGPFAIKLNSRRNAPVSKAYLCIFICMATRAVHLELVSSLSAEAFLATLDRFVARRGRPHAMYSDCGTNFVGANRQLKDLYLWFYGNESRYRIKEYAGVNGFEWHFNPPHTPHFGGIWEAAVKSAKALLYKVTRERVFNFEELTTLFARIEAVLNSRPISLLPDGNSDGEVLTPGHFLIGAPLLSMPEKDHSSIPTNRLSRWQLITNSVQHFWKRWHVEYLQSLQKRPKWYHSTQPLKLGDIVMIPDTHSTPLNWKLARITEVHPGEDGIIRVVTIKDSNGAYKRPVHKLVCLSHLTEC